MGSIGMDYPVNEMFLTLQGEGAWTGLPMVFLRLQGCPVQCGWCDTAYSWFQDEHQKIDWHQLMRKEEALPSWSEANTALIFQQAEKLGQGVVKRCCLTGGEPALWDLRPLCEHFESEGWSLFCETSGTEPLRCSNSTWITVSPKLNMRGGNPVRKESLERADELKFPIARSADLQRFDELLSGVRLKPEVRLSLQPVSQSPTMTRWCIEQALKRGWGLSIQMHKILSLR